MIFKNRKLLTALLSAVLIMVTAGSVLVCCLRGYGEQLFSFSLRSGFSRETKDDDGTSTPEEPGGSGDLTGTDEPGDLPPAVPVTVNIPSEMHAVILSAGKDYLLSDGISSEALKKEIDAAVKKADSLMMNTAVIDLNYGDTVIYDSSYMPVYSSDVDILEYIIQSCRESNMYVYLKYDLKYLPDARGRLCEKEQIDSSDITLIDLNIKELCTEYAFD